MKTAYDTLSRNELITLLVATDARLQENSDRLNAVNEELEQATAALWDQSARLRTILNNIPVGVVVIRKDGRVEGANRAAQKLFGFSETLFIGRQLSEHLHFDGCEFFTAMDQATHAPLEAKTTQTDMIYELEVAAKRLPGVHHDSIVLILRDQTEAKREAAHRAELERELAQSQKLESLGTLAGGIAHEINTPIQYIGDNIRFLTESFTSLSRVISVYQNLCTAAQLHPQLSETVKDVLARTESEDIDFLLAETPQAASDAAEGVRRVAEIVKAIKEFSHPGHVERAAIDLNHAIETTAIITRNQWKYVAELEMNLDPGLPPISCHPGEINQVILNLIVNAADALSEHCSESHKGLIRISTRAQKEGVEIRIEDNGPGVPAALRTRIFDPFFTTKEPGKGTGQGLAICHSIIVKNHMGAITVDPKTKTGAAFVIRLPYHQPHTEGVAA